jgi:hypothetical protein
MSRFTFWPLSPELEEEAAQLRAELAGLALLRAGHRLAALAGKANFDPAEPRIPAGSPGGGRWTDGGGDTGYVRVAANDRSEDMTGSASSRFIADKTLDMTPADREKARKKLILHGKYGNFHVAPNPSANPDAPWYEDARKSTVAVFDDGIQLVASRDGVDADLIRAIMYVETTHGWYDEYTSPLALNDTILPMNVSVTNWGAALHLTREDLEEPFTNIAAGAKILKGIEVNLPANSPISAVATLYNRLNATEVTDYGARVAAVYAKKPWLSK